MLGQLQDETSVQVCFGRASSTAHCIVAQARNSITYPIPRICRLLSRVSSSVDLPGIEFAFYDDRPRSASGGLLPLNQTSTIMSALNLDIQGLNMDSLS